MKTKGRPKSNKIDDVRGPTGAYKSGAIGQRTAARREADFLREQVNAKPLSAQAGFHRMEDAAARDRNRKNEINKNANRVIEEIKRMKKGK